MSIALSLIGAPRDAAASCATATPGLVPRDGAIDVPTNVEPVSLWIERFHTQLELRDADGRSVAVVLEPLNDFQVRVRPLQPLRLRHEYSLVERDKRGRWKETRRFATGAGPDTIAPPPIELGAPRLTVENLRRSGVFADCCFGSIKVDLHLGITETTRSPSYVVTIAGDEPSLILPGEWDELVHGHVVDRRLHGPALRDELCMTIQPRDLAGNLGPERRVCVPINPPPENARWLRQLAATAILALVAGFALVWQRRRHRHTTV